jgi:2-keto-4-pentenoate hydratase
VSWDRAVLEAYAAARRVPRVLAPLSATHRLTVEEAYLFQDQLRDVLEAAGERVIGWKVGLTSPAAQQQWGLTEPVCGFLLARGVIPSGSEVETARFVSLGVEAEIAVVMREDLAGPGVSAPRALAAVAGAAPALELVDLRLGAGAVGTDLIADGVAASAVVLASTLADVSGVDLALEGLVYEHNGRVAATAAAAEVMGSPAHALAWLANHLGARGLALRSGDLVMTGYISTLLRPRAGDTVRATCTRLGTVAARFV